MIYAFHAPLFGWCLLYMFYLKFKNANTILYSETQKKKIHPDDDLQYFIYFSIILKSFEIKIH